MNPVTVSSSQILPADRRVDWIVGVPGGIPADRPVWKNITDPPYGADPTGARDASPAFNRALEDMPEGHALHVPPGIYRLDSGIRWQGSHRTLRGAGPGVSRLLFYGGLVDMGPGAPRERTGLDLNARRDGLTVDADLSQDGVKGETHIHLATLPPWVKPGHLYIIDQLDDPGFVRSGGEKKGGTSPRERAGNGPRGLGQIVRVTAVRQNGPSDFQVDFEIPLYYGFRTSQQAQIAMAGYDAESESPLFNCGIEDLQMDGKYATGWSKGVPGHFIRMDSCANCWVKNVEGNNVPANCHLWASFCYRLEIRDSCFHDAHGYGGGEAYGIGFYNVTSASLVENNILRHLHGPMVACYGASGNVFAYNYVFEGAGEWRQFPSVSTHGAHAYMNLWEGNHGVKTLADWTWGSASHGILFRNRLVGWEPGGVTDQCAISIEYYNRKWSVIGNVLGTAGYHTIYERKNGEPGQPTDRVIYKLGYEMNVNFRQPPHDDLATMDLFRHGNWDAATRSVQWDSQIQDHDLPPSLYLKAKPSWFGDLPWPAFGPDIPGLEGKIPAQVRFWGAAAPPSFVPPAPEG